MKRGRAGSCDRQLLHVLGFNPPPLYKTASLFCYLKTIPPFFMGKIPLMEFCSLGSARQSHLFLGGDQALGGCTGRVSFRLYALEEKHLQLYCGVAALPPQDAVCEDRLVGWLQIRWGLGGAQGRVQHWAAEAQQVQQESTEGREALFMCWKNLRKSNLEKLTALCQGFWMCNYKGDACCSGLFSSS